MAERVLPSRVATSNYGFNWKPEGASVWTRVLRMWSHRGQAVLRIDSGNQSAASTLDIYVSKGGRSIRVFRGGKELV